MIASLAVVAHAPLTAAEAEYLVRQQTKALTGGERMVCIAFVSSHAVLDCLVRGKVDRMRRACTGSACARARQHTVSAPAPKATLEMPFHSAQTPSVEEMRVMAFDTPVYTAA